jgi:glycosyltransferase involved in cell wall biosynthesis
MMVRGYLPLPRPTDMVYAPIDLAGALAEGLSARGHQVDFFAPLGSQSSGAKIITRNLRPLATSGQQFQSLLAGGEQLNHYIPGLWDTYLAEEMFERARAGEYDLLHFQHAEVALPLAARYRDVPVVYTLNDPVYPWYKEVFELYASPNQHFISISNNQRRDAPDLNYLDTVYNGIDTDDFRFSNEHEDYLLFTGRIVPEKGVKEAIQVAEATDHRLLIIGPVPPHAQGYFDQYVKPLLSDRVLYLGFIEREQILPYYQKAKALILPIQWEEPFGLTSVEAMACGTPAIAIARGSMPEIIKHRKTGYLVESVGEMIEAVGKINRIDRRACRDHVKANFSLKQMVEGYEAAYQQALMQRSPALKLKHGINKMSHKSITGTKKTVRKLRTSN